MARTKATPSLLLEQVHQLLAGLEPGQLGEAERMGLEKIEQELPRLLSRHSPQRHERASKIHFDYALNGILETDASGSILDANPAATSILESDRKRLLGAHLPSLFADCSLAETTQHFQLLSEQGIAHAELHFDGAKGAHELALSSIQVDEALFLHIFEDVTMDRRLARELDAARQTAESANLAKDQFLANISHELRTPMNGIIGMAQLALMTALSPLQRDYMEKITQSGRTLLALLNDLLDFSKIEAGKMTFEQRPVDLFAVMDELSLLSAHSLGQRSIDVIFDPHPNLPRHITGDPLRITQILINLLGNALKFTSQGRIVLSIKRMHGGDAPELHFSVNDTGCGIAPDALARLFQPFAQADAGTTRRFGGTGLGLAISRQLAEGMGGRLTVTSSPGLGSCFTLVLPLLPTDTAQESLTDEVPYPEFVIECPDPIKAAAHKHLLAHLRSLNSTNAPERVVIADLPTAEQLPRVQQAIREHSALLLVTTPEYAGEIREIALTSPTITVLTAPLTPLALEKALQTIADPLSLSPTTVPPDDIPTEFQGARIAVAEDVEVNQQIIAGLLGRAGIEVMVANHGRQLLEQIERGEFVPELILMDVHMPEMDGLAATQALRAQGYTQPIIALSAGAGKAEQVRCLAAGMSDFLAKPIDLDELWGVLTCWLPPRQITAPASRQSTPPPAIHTPLPAWLHDTGIDIDMALTQFLGDVTCLEKGIRTFCQQHGDAPCRLTEALGQLDHASFSAAAHALIGAAASLGIHALAQACREAEHLPESTWCTAAPALIDDIRSQLSRLCQALPKTSSS